MAFTEEQKLLQTVVREFTQNEIRPRMKEILNSNGFVPLDLYKRCGELGFFRVMVPEEFGGLGLGMTEACIIHEELSKEAPVFGLIAMVVMTCTPMLLGTQGAIEKYLEPVMNGDMVISGAVTAPEGHTNVPEWQPLAKKEGHEYVLNGTKLFVTNNVAADVHIAFGLDENQEMKVFIFPADTPGFEHSAAEKKFGMTGSGGGTTTYKNVRVPEDMVFAAAVGDSMFYYNLYVICASIGLGAAEGILEKTIEYAKIRTSNFKPLTSMQAVSQKLAQLKSLVVVANSAIYDACALYEDPETVNEACLKSQICKAYVPEVALDVIRECIKLFGGMGYHNPEYYHYMSDAMAAVIMDLPTEYHFDGIANLIGLND